MKLRLKPGKWYICKNACLIPRGTQEESKKEALFYAKKAYWLHYFCAKEDFEWILAGVPFLVLMSGKIAKTFFIVTSKGPSGWICPDYRLLTFEDLIDV